ncbi:MAG: nucleotide sugar dehydrogenase [Gammaproteobacteria bacterium]|nr:nucleotide sugar dehydrogenase [Gammaproteobacteria bacterium]
MNKIRLAVVGLGYVGLPLALAFGRTVETLGFDRDTRKLEGYRQGLDPAGEVPPEDFVAAPHFRVSSDPADLAGMDYYLVAVPTPVDEAHRPDLSALIAASEVIGAQLTAGAVVVYESTVYPGVTEDVCLPVLERVSGLRGGVDFHVGYSPERINPGDREHRLDNVIKVVSGQDDATLDRVVSLYERVVNAGLFRASSIRVAEAAKVIENTQRDLNIALVNELAIIFNRMGVDTSEVLAAAGSKWNFLPFRPGLVGGHCIGVDPFYLTYAAQQHGYHPHVILAGRRINDGMGRYIAEQTVKQIILNDRPVKGARVLVMGLTFKEDCADLRNSRVIDLVQELVGYGIEPLVWDPLADPVDAQTEYGVELVELEAVEDLGAVVAAVAHREVREIDLDSLALQCGASAPFMDIKSAFDPGRLRSAGFKVWRL